MAQDGSIATGEDGGHPRGLAREHAMTHGEDAAVEHMQSPSRDAMVDRPVADPELDELAPSDDAVLARRVACDLRVRRSRFTFTPNDGAKVRLEVHAAIVAARACRFSTRLPIPADERLRRSGNRPLDARPRTTG